MGWQVDGTLLRRQLEPLVASIRFPTMSTAEFASFVVPLNVLSDTETCNVYKYFTCPERPDKWFETTKRKRPGEAGATGGGLYPEVAPPVNAETAALMPSAPDLLSGSRSDFERPPNYEESANRPSTHS